MDIIEINVRELEVGKVIAKDIYAKSSHPIVNKNTPVTHEHFHIFKVFNIAKVPVYKDDLVKNEEKIESEDVEKLENTETIEEVTFSVKYEFAVQQFKREFNNWAAGAKIEIANVRNIIIPLIDEILEDRKLIFELNNFSNPKDYLYHHCVATGLISAVIIHKLGYDRGDIIQMALTGCLADCGMSKIPTKIRDKRGLLNEMEFTEIRKHPIYSFNLIKDLTALRKEMKVAIYQHHERLDGSGYPLGKKIKEKTTIFSQIIAVADTFHAMTSERLYRSKESPFKVIEMIKEEEFGKFNIKVVDALTNVVADLPIGTKVELSNLERGEILFVNKFSPTRPIVKLEESNELIDLSKNRGYYISRIILDEEENENVK